MPSGKDFTFTRALLNLFRNVMKYSYWWKIDWFDCFENSANLKQGKHIHQPTAGSVPHACAQSYHAGSGNCRQLFHPYWGPPARQSHWVNERGKPTSQKPRSTGTCSTVTLNSSSFSFLPMISSASGGVLVVVSRKSSFHVSVKLTFMQYKTSVSDSSKTTFASIGKLTVLSICKFD